MGHPSEADIGSVPNLMKVTLDKPTLSLRPINPSLPLVRPLSLSISIGTLTVAILTDLVLFVYLNGDATIEPLRTIVSVLTLFVLPGYLCLSLLWAKHELAVERGLFALGLS